MIISGEQFLGGKPAQVTESSQEHFDMANKDGFLKSLAKGAFESLIVKPGVRTTQALGQIGAFGKELQKGFQAGADETQTVDLGFLGKYDIEPPEGYKQVAGEALEAGAWLYAPARATVGAAKVGLKEGIKAAAKFGAKAGGVGGGMFGAGEALQEDAGLGEVAGQAAIGAGVGVGAGAVLGGAAPVVPSAIKAAKGAVQKGAGLLKTGREAAGSLLRAGKGVGESALSVPTRIAGRAAESIQKAGERQKLLAASKPHIREALKQGIPENDVSLLQAGSKADKVQRAEMLEIAKKAGKLDKGTVSIERPVRKVGETVVSGPVKFLIDVMKKGGQSTKKAISGLGTKARNARPIYDQFIQDMQRIGLTPDKGRLAIGRGSRVPEGDVKFYQQIFKELRPNKRGQVPFTGDQLHALRQKWWDVSKADQTFTQGPASYARRIRALLAKSLDDMSKGSYLKAQNQTREALTGIKEFARLLGYRGNLEDITTKDLKAGETFMRVFGNASDRPLSILNQIYDVSKKYGYKGDENIINQLQFADMLEAVYGQPSRSMGGQIARATQAGTDPQQVISGSIREMVKWSPYSGTIQLLRRSGFLGRRPQDVIEAFEKLIRTEAGLSVDSVAPKTLTQLFQEGKEGVKKQAESLKQDIKDLK